MIYVEALLAFLVGSAALMLILFPLLRPAPHVAAEWELPELEETRKGQALIALKEIEFDLATGKLSDADFGELKRRFTAEAVAAMREEEGGVATVSAPSSGSLACRRCGPRPEQDAIFCSTCGSRLGTPACAGCGATLPSGAKFCEGCGRAAA